MIVYFVSQGIGRYCRFAHQDSGINIALTTPEKLFSRKPAHAVIPVVSQPTCVFGAVVTKLPFVDNLVAQNSI